MKIHIYAEITFPEGMAPTKRVTCYAKGLIAAGAEVRIVCTHRLIEKSVDNQYPEQGVIDGISYSYSSGKYKRKNKIVRGLDWKYLDALRAYKDVCKNVKKDDGLFVYGQSLFMQLCLIKGGNKVGAKIIKECCEHPSALVNMKSVWVRFSKWYEYNFIMPKYDGFVAISHNLESFCMRYKRIDAKVLIVPILVENKNNIDYNNYSSPYKEPYIIHTGTMLEAKDGISKILYAFKKFKQETGSSCKLVFTGPHATDECPYINMIRELGIESDVELLGYVSMEEIQVLQHYASLTIIYKSDNLQTRNCFPTKLGEMLLASVPVITTQVGDANLYLENNKNAVIIPVNDERSLVLAIKDLFDDKNKARRLAEEAKKVALTSFNPIFQGKRLYDFIRAI